MEQEKPNEEMYSRMLKRGDLVKVCKSANNGDNELWFFNGADCIFYKLNPQAGFQNTVAQLCGILAATSCVDERLEEKALFNDSVIRYALTIANYNFWSMYDDFKDSGMISKEQLETIKLLLIKRCKLHENESEALKDISKAKANYSKDMADGKIDVVKSILELRTLQQKLQLENAECHENARINKRS